MSQCPACQSQNIEAMFNMGMQPMSLVALTNDPAQSYCQELHSIRLFICHACGHVHNADFDPLFVIYSAAGCRMYNNGSGWRGHMEEVHALMPKGVDLIVEIGAGDCEFLADIDAPDAVKLAIDPCEAVERAQELGLQYRREMFDADKHLPSGAGETLVIMRHLLEHEAEPRLLVEEIAHRARNRENITWIYIEVPNCENALKRCRIEDWTYEHPQHFTTKSMKALFHNCGLDHFAILPKYGGEVLSCMVQINPAEILSDTIDVPATIKAYQKTERGINVEGRWMRDCIGRVALWGGAGKSAMFIRKFGMPDHTRVVDSHDEKWLMCVPGTKIKITDPDTLIHDPVKYIIATASWRANDIRDEIIDRNIPCEGLLKFENGELVEVPLGRN